jgi:hypothetical protein
MQEFCNKLGVKLHIIQIEVDLKKDKKLSIASNVLGIEEQNFLNLLTETISIISTGTQPRRCC